MSTFAVQIVSALVHSRTLPTVDRRLAEGAISIDEYSERRAALLDASERSGG